MFVAEAAVAKCCPVDLMLHVVLLLLLVGDELPVAFLNQVLVVGMGLEEVPQSLLAAEVAKGCLLVYWCCCYRWLVLFVQLPVALLQQVQGL
jgi:hypothetical protein